MSVYTDCAICIAATIHLIPPSRCFEYSASAWRDLPPTRADFGRAEYLASFFAIPSPPLCGHARRGILLLQKYPSLQPAVPKACSRCQIGLPVTLPTPSSETADRSAVMLTIASSLYIDKLPPADGENEYASHTVLSANFDVFYLGSFVRARMDGVCQPRRQIHVPFPGTTKSKRDHLSIGIRSRPSGARL